MLKELITNFKEKEVNGKKGLVIDLEKANSFEKNVYITYLMSELSAEDIFAPSDVLYQYNSELRADTRGSTTVVAKDYFNMGECAYLCSLHDVVVLLNLKKGYTGKRLILDSKNHIQELKDSKSSSFTSKFYTHAGINTVIKHLENSMPKKLIDMAFAKENMGN